MTLNLTQEQLADILNKIQSKALSPEGQKVLSDALSKADELKTQLDEERIISPKSLYEPFTV